MDTMASQLQVVAHERDLLADRVKELTDALRGMVELEDKSHRLPGCVNAEWASGIVFDAKLALGLVTLEE